MLLHRELGVRVEVAVERLQSGTMSASPSRIGARPCRSRSSPAVARAAGCTGPVRCQSLTMLPGFDPTLILWSQPRRHVRLRAQRRARRRAQALDLFGVVVLAAVVGLAGGIIRDLLIGFHRRPFATGATSPPPARPGCRPSWRRSSSARSRDQSSTRWARAVLRHRRHQGARLPCGPVRRSSSERSPASAAACSATSWSARSRPSCATGSTRSRPSSAPASSSPAPRPALSPVFPILGMLIVLRRAPRRPAP